MQLHLVRSTTPHLLLPLYCVHKQCHSWFVQCRAVDTQVLSTACCAREKCKWCLFATLIILNGLLFCVKTLLFAANVAEAVQVVRSYKSHPVQLFLICDTFHEVTTSYITTACGHKVASNHIFVHLSASSMPHAMSWSRAQPVHCGHWSRKHATSLFHW